VAQKTIDELQAEIEQLSQQLADTPIGDTAGRTAIRDMMAGLQESANELTGFDQSLQRTLKTFTGITDASDTFAGSILKLSGETDGAAKIQAQAEEVFKKTFNTLNVGISVLRKVAESTFAMAKENDQAVASFNRSSGAAGAYNAELIALEQTNRNNGISTQALGESYGALQANLTGFGVMAESERMRLGELGAQFAMAGVSGADFAGTLQTMTRGFGMSTAAATGMATEAMNLAQTLGKDVGQVMSELNQALPKLAAYGDDATRMFGELQKAAQRTGLEIGELMDMTSRYDTFDSAASAAGNLNAVLNSQSFSTMGFLDAVRDGGDSLTNYLTDTLKASGMAWESMDYYQRKAIANAGDMDVATLNNLMNAEAQTAQERDRAATLEEAMAAGRSLWDEMSIAVKSFAIAVTPVVSALTTGLRGINEIISRMREDWGVIGKLIQTAFAVAVVVKFAGAIWGVIKAIQAMAIAQTILNGTTPWGLAQIAVGALVVGGAIAGIKALMPEESYARGTDRTSGGLALVGEEGPELLVPPPNSAVVNNSTMTNLANQGAGGGGNNAAVVAAVRLLGSKLDTIVEALKPSESSGDLVLEIDRKAIGRVINFHLGTTGFHPLRLMDSQ
jgi:hypothetical protein